MAFLTLWTLVLLLMLVLQGVALSPAVQAESRGVRPEGQKVVPGKSLVDNKPLAEFVAAQTGKSWAVVIGINEYRDPAVPRLKYAVADARAVAQELERRSYQVTLLLNEQATARAINTELRSKLRQRVGKQDRVLIYYAGHGLDDKVEGSQTMGYLLPVDGEKGNVPGTGISMGVVKEMADALPAKHVLFLIDACYGGVAGQQLRSLSKSSEAYVRQITRERGRQLMTAGGADQEALEASDGGHGLFTTYLLKGLAEGLADTNQDGVIPASELYGYVESRVFKEAHLKRHEQRPEFWTLSAEKGEFVFLTAQGQPASTAEQAGGTSSDELATTKAEIAAMKAQMAQVAGAPKATDSPKVAGPSTPPQVAKAYDLPQQAWPELIGKGPAPVVLVSAGSFQMGSTKEEVVHAVQICLADDRHFQKTCEDRYTPELPQHKVQLDAFYLDKYEVTNRLFLEFVDATRYETTAEKDGYGLVVTAINDGKMVSRAQWRKPEGREEVFESNRGDHPVVSVSWDDADAYCRWAGKRLPTEAEFEYAARAGTQTTYWWGNGNPGSRRVDNIADESLKRQDSGAFDIMTGYDDGYIRTAPVGSFAANPFGLHDMTGNVLEWTADWYDETYYKNSPERNPKGPSSGKTRVSRGGFWGGSPDLVRSASRFGSTPTMGANVLGFRCAQDFLK